MLLICLLLQWHDPPVRTQTSQSRPACSPHSGMRLGRLSQIRWHGVILLPLIRSVFFAEYAPGSHCFSASPRTVDLSRRGQSCSLLHWQRKCVPEYLDSSKVSSEYSGSKRKGTKREWGHPVLVIHQREAAAALPGGFAELSVWAGGLLRNGPGAVLPGPSHVSLLCFHHHLCPPSAQMWKFRENKQMLFDKSK